MWFGIVTLFPAMFNALLEEGVVGRAFAQGLFACERFNPRDYADNARGYIDDKSFGGGAGMLLQPGPLMAAIAAAKRRAPGQKARVVYLSPAGSVFQQSQVPVFLEQSAWIFVAGRYEGIDHRVVELAVDEVWSIGDYVLSGGELAVMVMMDALLRQLPGVLGDAQSVVDESFAQGLLEYPQYTRPAVYAGCEVPTVLQSGDHAAIARWRLKASLGQTWKQRPDLLAKRGLTTEERVLLEEFIGEVT